MDRKSRTYHSAHNIVMGLANRIVTALLTFVGRQIFLQILSLDYLGINGLFVDVLKMLTLADLGFATAMNYSFYKPLAENDERKLAGLIHFYKRVYNIIALVVAVLGVALTPFLHIFVKLQSDIPYLEAYYLIALANTVVSYLFVYKASIITADQKGYLISQYAMGISILNLVAQIVVLYLTHNYMLYCSVTFFTTLLNNLIVSAVANKHYPFIRNRESISKEEKQQIFTNLKSVFLYKLSTVIISGTDNILISILVGTMFVGKYSNYNVAVTNLSHIAFILFNSLTPSIGNLIVKDAPQKRFSVFRVIMVVSFWISNFFIFCLYFLMDDFIVLWLGPEYIFGMPTKIAILLNFYLLLAHYPVLSFREATGLYQKTKYVMLCAAGLNIALSIALGIPFGVAGIILASFIAKLATFFWYEAKILFRSFFDQPVGNYFWRHILNFLLLAVCILACERLLPLMPCTRWWDWLWHAVLYALIINFVCLLRFCRTAEFQQVKGKLLQKLFRRQG